MNEQGGPGDDAVVRWLKVGGLGYLLSILLIVTLPLRWEQRDMGIFVEAGSGFLWAARLALGVLALAGLSAANRVRRQLLLQRVGGPAGPASHAYQVVPVAVMRMAFAGAIGIYGLLLYMVGGGLLDVAIFGAVSIVAIAWYLRLSLRDARR